MLSFFLAMTGVLLLMALVAALVSMAFGYFMLGIIGKATGKKLQGPGTAFILGLPLSYSFSLIKDKNQMAFLAALIVFALLGVYYMTIKASTGPIERHVHYRRTATGKAASKHKPRSKFIELGGDDTEEETARTPMPEKESSSPFAIFEKINPLAGNTTEKAAKEFVLTRFGEKGTVKRSWEEGGNKHVLVQTTSGTYSLTMNAENAVTDWDKN